MASLHFLQAFIASLRYMKILMNLIHFISNSITFFKSTSMQYEFIFNFCLSSFLALEQLEQSQQYLPDEDSEVFVSNKHLDDDGGLNLAEDVPSDPNADKRPGQWIVFVMLSICIFL